MFNKTNRSSLAVLTGLTILGVAALIMVALQLRCMTTMQELLSVHPSRTQVSTPAIAIGQGLDRWLTHLRMGVLEPKNRYHEQQSVIWSKTIVPSLTELKKQTSQWTGRGEQETVSMIGAQILELGQLKDTVQNVSRNGPENQLQALALIETKLAPKTVVIKTALAAITYR